MANKNDKAREAMLRRSKEKNKPKEDMQQYYIVIGVFIATMVIVTLYTLLNPAASFAQMPVIDEGSILVHNGQGHSFMQGSNEFFGVSLILYFLTSLLELDHFRGQETVRIGSL